MCVRVTIFFLFLFGGDNKLPNRQISRGKNAFNLFRNQPALFFFLFSLLLVAVAQVNGKEQKSNNLVNSAVRK